MRSSSVLRNCHRVICHRQVTYQRPRQFITRAAFLLVMQVVSESALLSHYFPHSWFVCVKVWEKRDWYSAEVAKAQTMDLKLPGTLLFSTLSQKP